MDRIT